MDLTTLVYAVMLAAALLGSDAALHPPGAIFDAAVVGNMGATDIDRTAVNAVLAEEVARIGATRSIVAAPEIKVGASKGVGFALAEAAKVEAVVIAFQQELGYEPDQIRVTLMGGSPVKALVTGRGLGGRLRTQPFDLVLEQRPDETLVALIHRAALAGAARIDPYFTALNLLQRHEADKDFTEAEAIIGAGLAVLPPTPVNRDRALFENLRGMMALFRNQPEEALRHFDIATRSDPDSAVAELNAAFAEMQLDRERDAVPRMERLVARLPASTDKVILSTAHMTWGGALLGLGRLQEADAQLATAVWLFPGSSSAQLLWSDARRELHDADGAQALQRKAFEVSDSFENYAELAALYFELAWRDRQPLTHNRFSNPERLQYN